MAIARALSTVRLVNGSTGDPVLYLDYPGNDDAFLFDCGNVSQLTKAELADLRAVFLTHHHIDHFNGFDLILRANLDENKTLDIVGPEKTIQRVYQRVTAYDHPFFPFMKLVIRVTELLPGKTRVGTFSCADKFAPPVIAEQPWTGPVCFETNELTVEAAPCDHTVPCWAYALVEKTGYHPDPAKLAGGLLRPGQWVTEALQKLRAGADPLAMMNIQGGQFTLGALAENYFEASVGARVAFIVDTQWSPAVQLGLIRLAKGAWRLFGDSFYAAAQAKEAAKHRHLMAPQTAELAKKAKVEQLVLIHFSSRYAGKYDALVAEAATGFPRVSAEIP